MTDMITLPPANRNSPIGPDDILDPVYYAENRKAFRAAMLPIKAPRRISVGPYATFYFENFQTMWYQVHEMLHAEKGGAEQLKDELVAFNPLIPNGNELVATLMFEINDPDLRTKELSRLGGVEKNVFLEIDGDKIYAKPEMDVERTKESGRTSSVHFLHFPLSAEQKENFTDPSKNILLGIDHAHFHHITRLNADNITSLRQDLAQ